MQAGSHLSAYYAGALCPPDLFNHELILQIALMYLVLRHGVQLLLGTEVIFGLFDVHFAFGLVQPHHVVHVVFMIHRQVVVTLVVYASSHLLVLYTENLCSLFRWWSLPVFVYILRFS